MSNSITRIVTKKPIKIKQIHLPHKPHMPTGGGSPSPGGGGQPPNGPGGGGGGPRGPFPGGLVPIPNWTFPPPEQQQQPDHHLTAACMEDFAKGFAKYHASNTMDSGLEATFGGDLENNRAYQAHHKDKLESMFGLNTENECQAMGWRAANAQDMAGKVAESQQLKSNEQARIRKLTAEYKSTKFEVEDLPSGQQSGSTE